MTIWIITRNFNYDTKILQNTNLDLEFFKIFYNFEYILYNSKNLRE